MWGAIDFSNVSKLGSQVGEVLSKATTDVRQNVDSVLGKDHNPAQAVAASTEELLTPPLPSQEQDNRQSTDAGGGITQVAPDEGGNQTATAPSPPTKKKIVRRVVKRVVKVSQEAAAAAAADGATTAPESISSEQAPAPTQQRHASANAQVSETQGNSSHLVADDSSTGALPGPHAAGQDKAGTGTPSTGAAGPIKAQDANGGVPDANPPAAESPEQSHGEALPQSEEELRAQVSTLQAALQAREKQLERQAGQLSDLEKVVEALSAKNQELVLNSTRISEGELEAMRAEFEQRLGVAERKVYALSKERDALKKGSEKLSDVNLLVKEKDDIIKQVMEEGEKLSRKVTEMEGAIKKLRGQVREVEVERDKARQQHTAEVEASEALKRGKAKAERDLAAALEHSKAELEAQRLSFEGLLAKAKQDQADAEGRARVAAAEGLARQLRDSEARGEALSESVLELRDALERQRQAADLREEMLKQDMRDLERRCQAAEGRHAELAAKLPDTARPLLRQIEAMQAAAAAQAEAWSGAERALTARINDAEARAAAAAEKERLGADRLQVLQSKYVNCEATLNTARSELKRLSDEAESLRGAVRGLEAQLAAATAREGTMAQRLRGVQDDLTQLQHSYRLDIEAERAARQAAEAEAAAARVECSSRVAALEAAHSEALASGGIAARGGGGDGSHPEPPAMAGPGFRWMLVRDGDGDGAMMGGGAGNGGDLTPKRLSRGNSIAFASDLEHLRAQLRQRSGEMAMMEVQIRELEATRDRLAEELVASSARAEATSDIIAELERLRTAYAALEANHQAAVEMLGEKDERMEELWADLLDVKHLYRDQIEFMATRLAELSESESGTLGVLAARAAAAATAAGSSEVQPEGPH